MWKRFLAGLCAAALLVVFIQSYAAGEEWDANIIFLALNDSPVPLSDSTMPINVGGTIYLPYFMLDANQNGGIRLGIINGGQDKVKNTLTLYNTEPKNLTFDLRTGLSYDYIPDGERQTPTAIIRNGQIYVSASSTCSYFGVKYIYSNIQFGDKSYPYIRIRTDNVALDDASFKSSASTTYLIQLQNYYRSVTGQGGDNSSATVSPAPSVPSQPTDSGQDRRGVRVYLAVRSDTGESGSEMLDQLRSYGWGCLLLVPADQVAQRDDLIRQAVGEGHMVGLIIDAENLEKAQRELEEANEVLSHVALTNTRIVLAEDPAVAQALGAEGWLCWDNDIDGVPGERSSSTVYYQIERRLEERESQASITLDDSSTSASVLSRLLDTLREDGYSVRLAVESEF